jgi:hypothetical protein
MEAALAVRVIVTPAAVAFRAENPIISTRIRSLAPIFAIPEDAAHVAPAAGAATAFQRCLK